MTNRSVILIVATLALAAASWLSLSFTQPPARSAHSGPSASAPRSRFTFPRGHTARYRLSWKREDETALPLAASPGQRARFAAELEGELLLSSFGEVEGSTLVGLSLSAFTAARVDVMGEALIDGKEAARARLSGQTAYLEIDRRGRAQSIAFDEKGSDLFRHLVTSLVAELDLELPEGVMKWSGSGPGSFGRAEVEFEWASGGLRRARSSYAGMTTRRLTSSAEIQLDAQGLIRTLSAAEEAEFDADDGQKRTGEVFTELHWLEAGRFMPENTAQQVARSAPRQAIGVVRAGASADRKLLDDRVAGLTGQEFLQDLADFARLGSMADEQLWLWRATGLLRQQPELARQIPQLFQQAAFTADARSLALDVLVLAGTSEAQQAVLRVLGHADTLGSDERYIDTLQRLAALREPTPESIAAVHAAYGEPGERGVAAAYTLGALAGALEANGQRVAAAGLVGELASGLDGAAGEQDRIGHLGALGNAGIEREVERVAAYRRDSSPLVRAATARALRKTPSDLARDTLHDLSADPDGHVQRAALTTLRGFPLDAADLEQLSAKMISGELVRDNDSMLLSLAGQRPELPAARGILQRICDRNPDDVELRARSRRLLGQQ